MYFPNAKVFFRKLNIGVGFNHIGTIYYNKQDNTFSFKNNAYQLHFLRIFPSGNGCTKTLTCCRVVRVII